MFRDCPFEYPFDSPKPFVDFIATKVLDINHVLTHCLKSKWSKRIGKGIAVKCFERPEGEFQVHNFRGALPVSAVVLIRVVNELQQDFIDQQSRGLNRVTVPHNHS